MLGVYEIFHSLQGEGPFAGRPAVFLRLFGCVKPYCSFCDTPEALELTDDFEMPGGLKSSDGFGLSKGARAVEKGEKPNLLDIEKVMKGGKKDMPVNRVLSEIMEYGSRLVVITGGEPFLQWENGLAELDCKLAEQGLEVQYESSGRAGIPPEAVTRVVLSPKKGQWPAPETLSGVLALKVVWDEENADDVLKEIAASGVPKEKVWLMALGASRKEQLARMPLLWDVCCRHGYRLSPRLHILAFDRKKGI